MSCVLHLLGWAFEWPDRSAGNLPCPLVVLLAYLGDGKAIKDESTRQLAVPGCPWLSLACAVSLVRQPRYVIVSGKTS